MMRWLRPAARLSLSLLALPLLALSLCSGSVQAQSALRLFEGSWGDLQYGCDHPWHIAVSGDTITFELPLRKPDGISYYSTDEKILGVKDNVIDTVTVSMTDDDILDTIGDRFSYTVEASKFLLHDHRRNRDYVITRCEGRPVAAHGVPPQRG
jgi:hypothetical protein